LGTGGVFLRKLRARVADEPTGFVWIEKGRLAGSGYPASRAQVEWLVKNGIGSILTLTEDSLPTEFSQGQGVGIGQVPMKDHQAPSIDLMEKGVEFIEEQIKQGRTVLVHCLAGEGRTGCVLAAYLIRTRGIGAERALSVLRSIKPAFVETRQEKAVYEFASGHRRD
jgi:atypical dual specificity phosphatase